MSDHNQINRVVQNIVNTNNLHIQEESLMDIENQKKPIQNVHNHNDQSVLSTMSSEELNNKNELLDVSSNESNLNSSEEIITFKSKEKKIDYSFANEYFDEVIIIYLFKIALIIRCELFWSIGSWMFITDAE